MKKVNHNLDNLKGENPFKVPEGYMESLTDLIMSQLPVDKTVKKPVVVSFTQRVRPWFYLAAVFAGLGFFIKVLIGPDFQEKKASADSLFVQSSVTNQSNASLTSQEDLEYQEYIENKYANYVLEGELSNYE